MSFNGSTGASSLSSNTRAQSTEQFGEASQEVLLKMLLSDPAAFAKCRSILNSEHFDSKYQRAARYIIDYCDENKLLPSVEQIKANTGMIIEKFSEGSLHTDALVKDVESFAKYKAMELAVLDGVELLQTGRAGEIALSVQAALDIRIGDEEAPFQTLWIDETHTVPPPVYLIKPWLVRDTVTCVYGAPGSFKSFFCLQAAFSLATGTPFNGHPVAKTSVAYLAAEGQGGIAMRLDAIKEHSGIYPSHTDMLLITQAVNLLDPASVDTLIRYLKKEEAKNGIKFGVLFIDTYSQCIAGADENSASVASAASASMIKIRRELSTTVVYVHHTGKDETRGMRGSDALRGNTDGAVEIRRGSETAMTACAVVKRAKDVPIGARIDFETKVVAIPRLHGQDIDASLVCVFGSGIGAAVPLPTAISRMADQQTRRSILSVMNPGDELSVGKVIRLVPGMHDNKTYKTKVADVLPINIPVEVEDQGGRVLGVLIRKTDASKANNAFGVVVCQNKVEAEGQQSSLLVH
jgi:KaiC/GvpD/RAD55 family RecA-like ATPase